MGSTMMERYYNKQLGIQTPVQESIYEDMTATLEAFNYMGSSMMSDIIYPKVAKSLSNPTNRNNIKKIMDNYLDRNQEWLTQIAPVHQMLFGDKDKTVIMEALGLTSLEVNTIIKDSPDIYEEGMIINYFNLSVAAGIRYGLISKNQKLVDQLSILLTLSYYPTLYSKYIKFQPNMPTMTYAINNMSKKFKIKTEGLWGTLVSTSKTCLENYEKRLIEGKDKTGYVDYCLGLKDRLNSFFKNLTNEYMIAKKEGKFINTDTDESDPDNYSEADNSTLLIRRSTESIMIKINTQGVDIKTCSYAAKLGQVSVNDMRTYCTNVVNNGNMKLVRELVESLLYIYLVNERQKAESIHSNNFLITCLNIYKRANSKDKNTIRIKQILDELLKQNTDLFLKTTGPTTLNNYRRAIYIYFVLVIQVSTEF